MAETGIDMACFGTAVRLAVWAGVAPCHDASAGKPRSGRTGLGKQPLRTVLTQLAHAAARRGKKRAVVAHAMVVRAFHRLSRHAPYQDLGATYFDAQWHHLVDRLTWRIERLGYRVHLERVPAV
jgi:transposase